MCAFESKIFHSLLLPILLKKKLSGYTEENIKIISLDISK